MHRTIRSIAVVGALFFAALAAAQNEAAAWKALDKAVPNNSYPAQGRVTRGTAPSPEQLVQSIDATLPVVTGTKAEPVALYYRGNAYFAADRFEEALAIFEDLAKRFPEHGLCRAVGEGLSLTAKAIADCRSEIEVRKTYKVTRLPHAVLDDGHRVVLHTTLGDIEIALYEDVAKETVANFKKLVREGQYNDTYFHYVQSFRRIVGGCPNTRNADRRDDGQGNLGYTLPLELSDAMHTPGAISMVSVAGGRSHGCQFTICVSDQPDLNNSAAVFGQVVKGLEIARLISQERADDDENPYEHVTILGTEIVETKK